MKFPRTLGVLTLAALALTGCDDEGSTGVEIDSFAGLWNATQFEYSDDTGRTLPGSGEPLSVDAVSLGGSVVLDVEDTGAFTGNVNIPTVTPDTGVPVSGTISLVDENTLSITFDEDTLALVCATPETCLFESFNAEYSLNGDVLTFVNDDTEFDFDAIAASLGLDPAGTVDATLTVTLER